MEDRFLNHLISSARVVVENVIAGVKRCRIVTDVLRLTTEGISDLVMEIAYPPKATLDQDTGFQGYEPAGVLTRQPKKTARPGLERGGQIP